jgi:FlaG/FlaF family flagellin (archaellin)
MNKPRNILKAIAFLGALVFTGTVSAQASYLADDKIWTGAICSPSGGGNYSNTKITASGIKNEGTSSRYVSCSPTVDTEQMWDLADNNGGTDNGSASLFVDFDFSTALTSTVTCIVQLINNNTNTVVETQSKSVEGTAGDATVSLSFFNFLTGHGDNTAMGMSCLLPPQVKLTTINIEEYSDTGTQVIYP